ncbi:intermembrane transport protein PqiB [Denitrificimonas caeni]|uniref:intermembrane transport protein PqiB n=1 Tax=Denitrificimonas caeni TaxID=521720 RepID=UPI00196258E3|nr:intermembrane transport protein PqiB [Denitrificimonas caeni]
MSEPTHALRRTQRSFSPVWIVPIVALLIGAWMLYDNLSRLGSTITLTVETAEGIEAGKTLIKTRNVEIGKIEKVSLSKDLKHAVLIARMSPQADEMLNKDTQFWVEKPRIGLEGVSGLGTVLSGAYIQLLPGNSTEKQDEFTVLENPPIAPADAPGLRINLTSHVGSSVRIGDAVSYQGYTVGRVEDSRFDPELREMHHRLYIQSPYEILVTSNTRFWTTSGLDISLDSQGFSVNMASLESLISGGITFGVASNSPMGSQAKEDADYVLFSDEKSAQEGHYNDYLEYVLLVDDTVRGLSDNAPVEYRGVRIGTVISVPWNFTAPQPDSLSRFAIPVLIRIEPQRFDNDESQDTDLKAWASRLDKMVKHGMRATLKSGNLLTGALFVDLNFYKEALPFKPMSFAELPVFPTISAGFAQIEQKVSNLLDKLNHLNVEPVIASLDKTLVSTQQTMEKVNSIAASVDQLLADPAISQMPKHIDASIRQLRDTLSGFAPDSQGYNELTQSLSRLEKLMQEMQPVIRTLSNQPNALIFNKTLTEDPQPRAKP